jgi:hypothetical protein
MKPRLDKRRRNPKKKEEVKDILPSERTKEKY